MFRIFFLAGLAPHLCFNYPTFVPGFTPYVKMLICFKYSLVSLAFFSILWLSSHHIILAHVMIIYLASKMLVLCLFYVQVLSYCLEAFLDQYLTHLSYISKVPNS